MLAEKVAKNCRPMRKHSCSAKWAQGWDNNVQQGDDAEERRSRLLLCVRKDQEHENIKNGSYDTFTCCESDLGCHVDNDQSLSVPSFYPFTIPHPLARPFSRTFTVILFVYAFNLLTLRHFTTVSCPERNGWWVG